MFRKLLNKSLISAASIMFGATVICNSHKNQTYVWGNGYYQARPDALLQFKNFTPKHIKNLPHDLEKLFFSEYYEAGIDKKGQLYIWQKHAVDANLDENNRDQKREAIKLIQKDVKSVKFTSGYIWTLDKNGKVYQLPIVKKLDTQGKILSKQLGQKRQVQPLRGSIQIQAGRDHVIALNEKGEVFAMGDDTYGQCGQADTDRNTNPPFSERRIKYPVKVKNISDIVQIAAGTDHNLALDRLGNLYGWGSNSNLQLSHQNQFSKMNNPLICTYNPIRISKNLDNSLIKKIVAGDQFTVIVAQNKQTGSGQVFTCGTNLRGQLAINQIKHLGDIQKVQKLSNYLMKVKGQNKKVLVDQIQCGKNHCIALLNIGYIMEWGDNQYGQLGNKKRSPSFLPIILQNFMGKKVIGVYAGQNNTGVILQQETQTK